MRRKEAEKVLGLDKSLALLLVPTHTYWSMILCKLCPSLATLIPFFWQKETGKKKKIKKDTESTADGSFTQTFCCLHLPLSKRTVTERFGLNNCSLAQYTARAFLEMHLCTTASNSKSPPSQLGIDCLFKM